MDTLGTELAFDRVPHLPFQALKQTMMVLGMKLQAILVSLGLFLNTTICTIFYTKYASMERKCNKYNIDQRYTNKSTSEDRLTK